MIANKVLFLGFIYFCFFFIFPLNGINLETEKSIFTAYSDGNKNQKITFEKDIKPIMNTYCGGTFCHHGKPSAWTNYKVTKLAVDSGIFYDRVIDKKDMPKKKPLPKTEFETLKKWLEQGAPEK